MSSRTAISFSVEKEQRFYLVSREYTAFCLVRNKLLGEMSLIFLVNSLEALPGLISLGGLLVATVLEFPNPDAHRIATKNKLVPNICVHGV